MKNKKIEDKRIKDKVAGVIFLNEDKKIMLFLRDNKPTIPHPNKWALIGGHIEEGEKPLEALKREIKEEIEYDLGKTVFIDTNKYGVGNLAYIFKSKIDKKTNELKLNEGQKLGFFSFEESMKLDMPLVLKKFLIKHKGKILEDF